MSYQTAVAIIAQQNDKKRHRVEFVAEYMARSSPTWRDCPFYSLPKQVARQYIEDADDAAGRRRGRRASVHGDC